MKIVRMFAAAAMASVMAFSAGTIANAAVTSTDKITYGVGADNELKLSAEVPQGSIYEGDSILVKASANGGSGEYKYTFTVKNSKGAAVKNIETKNSEITVSLDAGSYTVVIDVTDGAGNKASAEAKLTVEDRNALVNNGTSLSKRVVSAGEKITLIPSFKGGKEPYTYNYSYFNRYTNKSASSGFISKKTYAYIMPTSGGYYQFTITAKDADGREKSVKLDAVVVKKTNEKLSMADSKINTNLIAAGGKIMTENIARGGTAPYKYRITYKDPSGKWIYLDSDYTYSKSRSFNLPVKSGAFAVRVSAKDYTGAYSEKIFNVNVKPFNIDSTSISSTSVDAGKPLTMTIAPQNNIGSVKYHYSYHYEGKNWTYLGDYVSNSTRKFTFSYPGVFYIRVGAKDGEGTYREKQFKITVKSPKVMNISGSTISSTLAQCGTAVRLNVKTADASGKVKYHYSYHAEGKPWTYLGDYTTTAYKDFRFGWNNVYYVRVGAKDEAGIYREKQFRINIFSKYTKTVKQAVTLKSSANWSSQSMVRLQTGAKVNVIKTYGKWTFVRYNNKTGYLYEPVFG